MVYSLAIPWNNSNLFFAKAFPHSIILSVACHENSSINFMNFPIICVKKWVGIVCTFRVSNMKWALFIYSYWLAFEAILIFLGCHFPVPWCNSVKIFCVHSFKTFMRKKGRKSIPFALFYIFSTFAFHIFLKKYISILYGN